MTNHKNGSNQSVIYISHGGGPLPLLGDAAHAEMISNLKYIAATLTKPSAIIVISAHWEQNKPTITNGAQPALIYDYSGFPKESYAIQYAAPGEPLLATRLFDILRANGIESVLDKNRGFDHGVFVPLKIMYPDANIPCVQLSLVNSLNPIEHINIGKALSQLSEHNLLIIGSGFSFHNLPSFFSPATTESQFKNTSFEQWLIETCSSHALSEAEREHRLVNWVSAPAARYCHPREEHLLPLHVCYGVAKSPAKQVFTFDVMGKQASAYIW